MADKGFPIGWSAVAKPCDTCKTAASLLFCCEDSTYFCMECDAKLHGTNRGERVWMCEGCEQAPASVTYKADAAALCITCDHDIHSANPIASRQERIPVAPFYTGVKSSFVDGQASPSLESNPIIIVGYQATRKLTGAPAWHM